GDLSGEQFASAFQETARVGGMTGQGVDLPALGGGIQDVMRVTGARDPRAAAGWIRQIGQQARIVDLDKQVRAIVPAISGAKEFGATPEQAAELMAYLTMRSGDVEGRKSSTGAVNFMQMLQEATTEAGAILPTGRSTKHGKLFGGGGNAAKFRKLKGGTFEERLAEVQDWYASASQPLRNEFIGKLQGEAKVKGALISLIGRDPGALSAMGQIRREVGSPGSPNVHGAWESFFTAAAGGAQEPARAADKALESDTEQNLLGLGPEGRRAAISARLEANLRSRGVGPVEANQIQTRFAIQSKFGSPEKAIENAIISANAAAARVTPAGGILGDSLPALDILLPPLGALNQGTMGYAQAKAWFTGPSEKDAALIAEFRKLLIVAEKQAHETAGLRSDLRAAPAVPNPNVHTEGR
ncbi:MAG TPA: hypothetical protein VLL76_01575, partial [Candidatus Omnitrophota bacterium]|nr:hypothetical protein [Candidatus Omnitrophota bacterium]